MRFTSIDYCINGVSVSPKVPTTRFVNAAASKQDKNKFRKRQEG
jgi:hypothetical protein